MNSPRRPRRPPPAPVAPRAGATPPPAPAWWRDAWAWASVVAVVPLVLHSLGAPLGEPVADDFDNLHYALFSGHQDWLSGGGSRTFWRPLAYQGYYGLLSPVFLARPPIVVGLHILLLAVTALLLYRTLRRFMPGPWAAAAASFPLLAESTRALIAVPVHFVDLGLLLFSALALHEAAASRFPATLLALLAALLCKESAVATAIVLPWLPRPGTRRAGKRWRWVVGVAAVTLGWGLVYLSVRTHHGLTLPRVPESNTSGLWTDWPERCRWATVNSARAIVSLPAASSARDMPVVLALLLLASAAAMVFLRSAAARARLAGNRRLVVAGLVWSAVATAPLLIVYPIWSPQRVAFNSLGAGVAVSAALGAAHPALLVGLTALRLTMFTLSPGPPGVVSQDPPETGAFVDFEKLARIQRMMAETRQLLKSRLPTLPHGATVVQNYLPGMTYYAFGGDKAIQVWYRDSTLHWISFDAFRRDRGRAVATIVEWQPPGGAQAALVAPDAMRALLRASDHIAGAEWTGAVAELDRADSLQDDPAARVFLGTVASKRALCLEVLDRPEEAERAARAGLRLWSENPDSRYTLALLRFARGRLGEAEAQLDTLLALYPDDRVARELLERVRAARAAGPP